MTQLPNGWSYESINSIVEGGMIADGDWVESKDQDPNGQVRLTQLADVGDGEFRSRSDRWMNDEQASRLKVNYLQPGDLLMARMPDPLGRTCMVPENIGRALTVVDVAIIRIARKDVNPKFVMWLLNSPGIRQQIGMLASGTTRRRITRKNLGTIDLPMPPFMEQNRIVELLENHLSHLDAAVSYSVQAEAQLIELTQATSHNLINSGYSLRRLGEVAKIETGPAFKTSEFTEEKDSVKVLRGDNIGLGTLRWERTRSVPADNIKTRSKLFQEIDDIILAMDRPIISGGLKIAKVAEKDIPSLLGQRVARIRCGEEIRTNFLFHVLKSIDFQNYLIKNSTGTQLPHVTLDSIQSYEIPCPPKNIQKLIEIELLEQNERIGNCSNFVSRMKSDALALRKSLLYAAFTGELTNKVINV
jgi:type I restriction enzyme S subunit